MIAAGMEVQSSPMQWSSFLLAASNDLERLPRPPLSLPLSLPLPRSIWSGMVARLPFCHQRGVQDGSRSLGRSAARRERGGERRSRVPSLAYYSKKKKMTLRPVGRTSSASGETRREAEEEKEDVKSARSAFRFLPPSLPLSLSLLALFLVFPLKSQSTSKLRRAPQEERRRRRGVSARLQYSPARAGPTDSPSAAAALWLPARLPSLSVPGAIRQNE